MHAIHNFGGRVLQSCVTLYTMVATLKPRMDGWPTYMRYALSAGKVIGRKLPEWSTSVTRG